MHLTPELYYIFFQILGDCHCLFACFMYRLCQHQFRSCLYPLGIASHAISRAPTMPRFCPQEDQFFKPRKIKRHTPRSLLQQTTECSYSWFGSKHPSYVQLSYEPFSFHIFVSPEHFFLLVVHYPAVRFFVFLVFVFCFFLSSQMLKRHFAHEDYYVQLVELFHDVTYRTEMGQLLDLTSQPMDAPSDLTRRERQR